MHNLKSIILIIEETLNKLIKFLNLQNINNKYSDELIEAASEVINSGWYLRGKQTKKFEQEFSKVRDKEFLITLLKYKLNHF